MLVSEREKSVVALHLATGTFKTHSGLEQLSRCEFTDSSKYKSGFLSLYTIIHILGGVKIKRTVMTGFTVA